MDPSVLSSAQEAPSGPPGRWSAFGGVRWRNCNDSLHVLGTGLCQPSQPCEAGTGTILGRRKVRFRPERRGAHTGTRIGMTHSHLSRGCESPSVSGGEFLAGSQISWGVLLWGCKDVCLGETVGVQVGVDGQDRPCRHPLPSQPPGVQRSAEGAEGVPRLPCGGILPSGHHSARGWESRGEDPMHRDSWPRRSFPESAIGQRTCGWDRPLLAQDTVQGLSSGLGAPGLAWAPHPQGQASISSITGRSFSVAVLICVFPSLQP